MKETLYEIGVGVIVVLIVAFFVIFVLPGLRRRAEYTRRHRRQDSSERSEEDSLWIPNFIEENPRGAVIGAIVILVVICLITQAFVIVGPGKRGVVLTMGKVGDKIFDEGPHWKVPFFQRVERMSVRIQKVESTESTASHDLQEVSTTVAINYRLNPDHVNKVYQTLRHDYADRVIKPNIEESLKASTAQYTAEELITKREDVKRTLDDILMKRLAAFHIEVIAVSLTDFQFSQTFNDAIEAKVKAEQKALEARNKLKQVEYEAQQRVIEAEAQRNATVITAEALALQKRISADAEAYKLVTEATATAEAIRVITDRMTPEYAQYLHLMQWDGKYPLTMLGSLEDLGIIIDTTP